jgi:hypothetical protein
MLFLVRASLLLALLSLLGEPGFAQHVTIDSIHLARLGGLYLPAARRAIVFSIEPKGKVTRFRQYVFSSRLSSQQRRDIQLPGRFELINTAASRHHLLYQLHRRGGDSLLTLVVDTLGRVVKLQRERGLQMQWRELSGTLAPEAPGFLLGEPYSRRNEVLVRFLDPQLAVRWRHRFVSPLGGGIALEEPIVDSTHAWLLVTSNARSRRATTMAYCLELASGKVLCRLPLDYQGERRIPGVGSMGPGHSLLLAGYSYANNRPSRVRTGRLFYTRLHPDSTRSHDRLLPLTPANDFAHGRKILWRALQPAADGSVRLVGETYTSTSLGGHIAIGVATGIATLGLLRRSTTTLRPRDVVSLRLTPAGQLNEVRLLPLPEGGSFTIGGYLPARRMAQLAAQAGIFRLRGFSPDSNRVVLRTGQRILSLNVHSGQTQTLQPAPLLGHSDVWFIEPHNILLYNEHYTPQRVDLDRIAF